MEQEDEFYMKHKTVHEVYNNVYKVPAPLSL